MKLLSWMHRKIRQNNNEMLKEFPQGQTALNNHPLYPKQNHVGGGVNFPQPARDSYRRRSFGSLESTVTAADDPERDSSAESFHGFLAIGTLGSETYVSEPQTPTFVISVDNIAERETEATESELNLINEELEKVLAAAEAKEADGSSSRRNSHVSSNGRSSNTSTISFSLNRKSVEVMEGNESGKAATCPLQGYLFGSAVELPERKSSAGKKNRASLGELFQRHKVEESSGVRSERGEKQMHKDGDKTSINLMRKILRKKSSTANGEAADYASETKFHKAQMLHLFHKKVHPEVSIDLLKMNAHNKSNIKAGDFHINDVDNCFDDGFVRVSDDAVQLRNTCHYKNQSFPTQITTGGCDSIENRELWIKTDADCK
ncbi:hypothetical protein V2J09_003814 [Rumex salicifolius]